MMPAEPHRHSARGRARVDPSIVDVMPAAFELDMRLGPQLLHDLHLFLGAAAAIAEILVEPDELGLIPADADAQPKPAATQHVETRRLLGDECSLTLRQDQYTG